MEIAEVSTAPEIARCFPVMVQLRPRLDEDEFVRRVQRQFEQGYRLAALEADGEVRAVAGFRIRESLDWGKFMYVDDLVTDAAARSKNFGEVLMEWLENCARSEGCDELHLDSGVQREGAHRFYFRERMTITCFHFAKTLDE